MNYRVHHLKTGGMTLDQARFEQFLNSLDGEVVAIVPNVLALPAPHVSFVLVVEKLPRGQRDQAEPEGITL
ncbi:MAG: hypothetical protein MUF84_18485 [Anaerolineae bacterium]|jgi:hypothetical protein|nr:hypothetical protein [Anaerolineae bacterium]